MQAVRVTETLIRMAINKIIIRNSYGSKVPFAITVIQFVYISKTIKRII